MYMFINPSWSHLVPTGLHDVIQSSRGQFGPEEAVTLIHKLHHLVVVSLFERGLTFCEHLPHQHTWRRTNTSRLQRRLTPRPEAIVRRPEQKACKSQTHTLISQRNKFYYKTQVIFNFVAATRQFKGVPGPCFL